MSQASSIDVGHDNFEEVVVRGSSVRPVVVDFWAPWCAPCRMLAPLLDKVAAEFDGRMTLAKLNTDESQKTSMSFSVRGIPTSIVFDGGKEIARQTGAVPYAALAAMLKQAASLS